MNLITAASADSAPAASTTKVFLYFTPLILILYLVGPTQFLVDIATTYMLKNQLHASATQVSVFRLVTAIPVYAAVLFGLTRDLWNPLGRRDRGYLMIFSVLRNWRPGRGDHRGHDSRRWILISGFYETGLDLTVSRSSR